VDILIWPIGWPQGEFGIILKMPITSLENGRGVAYVFYVENNIIFFYICLTFEIKPKVLLFRQFGSCFCSFQTIWQLFWTFWHCRINTIYVVSVNLKLICTRCETGQKRLDFLPVFKAHTYKLYIFRQDRHILYLKVNYLPLSKL
jgi:hypothetical protein